MPKVFCAGNGQLHQISMESVMNTLDCMHDQQILLIQNDTPIVLNSSGGGIAATLDASYYKGTGSRNGKEREFVGIFW